MSAVADLYLEPVFYGLQDTTMASGRLARVIFPSLDSSVFGAPILAGTYPLIVFVHGSRSASDGLCPPDITEDYKVWIEVLHLLGRCGFVVVAPDVHDVLNSPEDTADVVEQVVQYMHFEWVDRYTLWRPAMFIDPDQARARRADRDTDTGDESARQPAALGQGFGVDFTLRAGITTPLGLAGHSWGARACALAARRPTLRVEGLTSIAGSWDDNDSVQALIDTREPTLMMAGTLDEMNVGALDGFWSQLTAPKHQALLHGLGHWDWFGGGTAGLHPCDADAPHPRCWFGGWTAAELLLTFMTKYLRGEWYLPPHLMGPSGTRFPLLPFYKAPMRCGLRVRWDDPLVPAPRPHVGSATFGSWEESAYPW